MVIGLPVARTCGTHAALRPRRLPPWLAALGIAFAIVLSLLPFFPSPEETSIDGAADSGEVQASDEEILVLHHLDRNFRIDAGLGEPNPGDAPWDRYLRWEWRQGFSNSSMKESVIAAIRELDETVEISPRGLAACAVAASMAGDDVLAREMALTLAAVEAQGTNAYAGWITSWLDGEQADEEQRVLLDEWAGYLLGFDQNPEWWESRVVLDLTLHAPPTDAMRLLRAKEAALVAEWSARHSASCFIGLVVLIAASVGLLLFFRYRPVVRRIPGASPVVRQWGILSMLGWFGWLTVFGYGVGFLFEAANAALAGMEDQRDIPGQIAGAFRFLLNTDSQLLLWQVLQLAGALWIWKLAGAPGLRLIGLRPIAEANPLRWFVPVLGSYALITGYYIVMSFARGESGIIDTMRDTTEAAQLDLDRWPWGAIFFSFLTGVVLAPVMEEIIHRGIIYQGFRSRFGPWPAMLLSAMLFGILHFYSFWGFIDVTFAGLVFAWIYEKTRSLWPAIILHACGNALITIDQWLLWGPR